MSDAFKVWGNQKTLQKRNILILKALIAATFPLTICFGPNPLFGMINPGFTPVELVNQSGLILHLKISPVADEGKLPAIVVQALKGQPPRKAPVLSVSNGFLANDLEKLLEGEEASALIFFANQSPELASMNINGKWFSLAKNAEQDAWEVMPDASNMRAVWDGQTEMLLRCVQYVLAFKKYAKVPADAGVQWNNSYEIGRVDGKVHGAELVDLRGDGRRSLWILSANGDRVFDFNRQDENFVDVTESLNVKSASKAICFADFNADGRVDFASWNGRELELWQKVNCSTFERLGKSIELEDGCIGLSVVDIRQKGRTGIVVSTPKDPILAAVNEDGTPTINKISSSGNISQLGQARACVVADFDNDGLADILQPYEYGGLFYKGAAPAIFEAPEYCGATFSGTGYAKSRLGDFDSDGLLDVMFFTKEGLFVWNNLSNGQFELSYKLGEPDYIAKAGMIDGSVCDVNNDGRQDFLALYAQSGPHIFFNRGFSTFGFAKTLDIMRDDSFRSVGDGQQAGLIADMNEDGGQDLVLVLRDGTVRVVLREVDPSRQFDVRATLDASENFAGPLTVTGWAGRRCLGAWNITAGSGEGFFARRKPGPVVLKWQWPGEKASQQQIVVEDEYIRVLLGPEKAAHTSDTEQQAASSN